MMTNMYYSQKLIEIDPWLKPYRQNLEDRNNHYDWVRNRLIKAYGSIENASRGYEYLGFNRGEFQKQPGWWYREWAPGAMQLNLIGDFNQWDRSSHPLLRDANGVWSIFLPDTSQGSILKHLSHLKVHVLTQAEARDRIPAYIKSISKLPDGSFTGQHFSPDSPYQWQHQPPSKPRSLRIYEAHIGMALEDGKVGSFQEFTNQILPRIHDQDYNAIQLMAIMHHPYYGSFGYQVSNFFAVSNYFGSPDDLKQLIDACHALGISVLLDIVHSHSVKNYDEGLNNFDGTDGQYFHAGAKGLHPDWDTRLFDYGQLEVLRFLLSNVRYWQEEFRFDGLRFDGVTSMIYFDHGHRSFASYDDYFNNNVDKDAVAYLQLANEVAHTKPAITIAEEVSGIPGLARPVDECGLGFNYRLAMGIPDYWIKLLRDKPDDEWSIENIYQMLTNRRRHEAHIAYVESHDQSLVGDKTMAFWLMDSHMYHNMDIDTKDIVIDRGMALHKIIRAMTFFLGGESWLNFIGNEFGHPEWVDFPRAGNNFSYHYARRQWSLVDNPQLRYQYLNNFDRQLMNLDTNFQILSQEFPNLLYIHEAHKCLIVQRNKYILIINLHPNQSYPDYQIGVPQANQYKIVLNTDDSKLGGFDRIDNTNDYPYIEGQFHDQPGSVKIYLPSRTAIVIQAL